MKYMHLCAEVNGSLKDILVSEETLQEEEGDITAFFPLSAKDVVSLGWVVVEAVGGRHPLPESFGMD